MASAATISATLILDKKGYDSGLKDAGSSADSFASRMKSVGSQMSSLGGTLIKGAFVGAAAGATLLGVELFKDVNAAMESEKVQSQLNAVLESTGGIAGVTAKNVNDYADAISKKTGIDDEGLVTAQNMLLTFTDIGKNVFPMTTQAVADMATAMNGGGIPTAEEMQQQAIQLGKALQDPDQGLGALARVGVNVDELKKKFTPLMSKEEKQILILQELQSEFGGSADAAGNTFGGQMAKLGVTVGNIRESIGAKLLPVLGKLATMFVEYINRPEVQAFIDNLAKSIASFAETAIKNIPVVLKWFKDAFGWLMDNKGVIVAVLAVLASSMIAFGISTLIALGPIVLVMLLIGLVVYLLYTAWTTNFGGIQQKTAAFWAWLQPIFAIIKAWLEVNIPIAIAALISWWNILVQTVTDVWNWISGAIEDAMAFITDLTSGQMGEWSDIWERSTGTIKYIVDLLFTNLKLLMAAFKAAFSGDWKKLGEIVRQMLDNAGKAWKSAITTAWNNIKSFFSGAVSSLKSWFAGLDWSEIGTNLVKSIATGLLGALPFLLAAGKSIFTALGQFFSGFFGGGGSVSTGSSEVGTGGWCFVENTPILMSDKTSRPIQNIMVGDVVISYDIKKEEFVHAVVGKVFVHPETKGYLLINGIGVTDNHPLFVNGEWKNANEIILGDMLFSNTNELEEVIIISRINETIVTYNLEIDDKNHNFFAGNVLVHNKATGTSGWRTVPPGHTDDSYMVPMKSGEEYAVKTKNDSSSFGGSGTTNYYHPQITIISGRQDPRKTMRGFT